MWYTEFNFKILRFNVVGIYKTEIITKLYITLNMDPGLDVIQLPHFK